MKDRTERLARVARGWDEAAHGYEAYFVPRFMPWVNEAVSAVGGVVDGPILVPCCGTFPELGELLTRYPDRELVGIDLSAGMVRVAREHAANLPNVSVIEGDASTLDPRWTGSCAAVVSVFGLQQLPEPEVAIVSWFDALAPGGRLSVVYWPETTEADGPFALLNEVLSRSSSNRSWEDGLTGLLRSRGAVIEHDEERAHPMIHPDAATFFDAFHLSGPLRALALDRGEDFMRGVRAEFLRRASQGVWVHHPRARHLVARRLSAN